MGSYVSVLSFAISAIAILLTLYTVITNRNQKRIDSFFRVQEFLMRPDIQDGRSILYSAGYSGSLPLADDEQMAKVYRSLAAFNTVASLVYRKAVPFSWVQEFWHHHLMELETGFDLAVKARESWRPIPWPHLKRLMLDVQNHECPVCGPNCNARSKRLLPE